MHYKDPWELKSKVVFSELKGTLSQGWHSQTICVQSNIVSAFSVSMSKALRHVQTIVCFKP